MLNPSIWKPKRDLKKKKHDDIIGVLHLAWEDSDSNPGVVMFGCSQTVCRAMSFSRRLGQKGKAWKLRTVLDISQQMILYFIPYKHYNAAWKLLKTRSNKSLLPAPINNYFHISGEQTPYLVPFCLLVTFPFPTELSVSAVNRLCLVLTSVPSYIKRIPVRAVNDSLSVALRIQLWPEPI